MKTKLSHPCSPYCRDLREEEESLVALIFGLEDG